MNIRTLAAATAATLAVGLWSGSALADETSTTADVAPGDRACIALDSSDPVRAEGVADRGVRFTLTLDGAVVSVSADDAVDFQADSDAGTHLGLYRGAAELCAENLGDEEAFVVLNLFSPDDGAAGAVAEPAPAPEAPAEDQPPAGESPASDFVQELIDEVEEFVEQVLAEVGL